MKTEAFALSLIGLAPVATAQTFAIDWSSIDGGGGTSTGGGFVISGSPGQPDAGTASGGAFAITGGFWSGLGLVQTPGAPLLTISRIPGTGTLRVSWQATGEGEFVPQESSGPDALSPASWQALTQSYQLDGSTYFFEIANPSGRRFFRLQEAPDND